MQPILIILHVSVCLALILIVLLQKGKGAGMGMTFGGGASNTVFGSSGATPFLQKVTTVAAIVFMLTSLGLSIFFGKGSTTSIMDGVAPTGTTAVEENVPLPDTGETQDQK